MVERLRAIVRWSWITLLLLLLQNVMGTYLNLYVDLTQFPSGDAAIRSVVVLDLHVLNAIAIIGTSAYVLAKAVRTRDRTMRLSALAGLAFVILAFFSGIEFTFFGDVDAFSFLMEVGFLGIIGCVVLVLYEASRLRTTRGTREAIPKGSDTEG